MTVLPDDLTVEPKTRTHVRTTLFENEQERIYVFKSEHVLSFLFMQNHPWVNSKDNNEIWDSWQNHEQIWFSFKRLNKDGSRPLNIYGKKRMRTEKFRKALFRTKNLSIADTLNAFRADRGRDEAFALISEFLVAHGKTPVSTPQDISKIIFPGLTSCDRIVPPFISPRISPALKKGSAREVAIALVGKRRVRKDLIREIALIDSVNLLELVPVLARVVPIDWIVQGLKERRTTENPERGWYGGYRENKEYTKNKFDTLGRLIGAFPPGVQRRLVVDLLTMNTASDTVIVDTCRMAYTAFEQEIRVGDIRVRTFGELHDELARLTRQRARNRRRTMDNERANRFYGPIKMVDTALLFKDLETPTGFKIVPAETAEQVVQWSQDMSNCIHSYISRAHEGRTVLLGVYKDAKLIANAEVCNNELAQLYGVSNARLPFEQESEIVVSMQEAMPKLKSTRFGMKAQVQPQQQEPQQVAEMGFFGAF